MHAQRLFHISIGLAVWLSGLSLCFAADQPLSWVFRKPVRPEVPVLKEVERVRTPIDAFLLQKLQEKGLSYAPEAERLTLVRRACFDLIGLPPTIEDMERARNDKSAGWFENVVERLLANPHYGERWGRHWLDAAGYADTIKADNDFNGGTIRDGMWRYRDYVVRAFNSDKPYDRFVLEQLAGDEMVDLCGEELSDEDKELLIATGFWRTAIDGTNNFERNRPLERFELLHDTIENMTSNLLGLTVHCARCHDHKFDPITQKDYYRLMACLTPAYNPDYWLMPQQRNIDITTKAEHDEIRQHNQALDRQAGALGGQVGKLRRSYEQLVVEAKYQALPEEVRAPLRKALATSDAKRTAEEKALVEQYGPKIRFTNEEVIERFNEADRRTYEQLEEQVADLRARKRSPSKIQALFDVGPVPSTHLLKRGNHETPGAAIAPGLPVVLAGARPFGEDVSATFGSSGRRLALARALTEPGSVAAGLLARVLVNRVWRHHFGRGIVATPGNLGNAGALPTHPELLDWLATEFMQGGWKIKDLHRLIMASSVYRQAAYRDDSVTADPQNHLLWKMPLRRLEAESIRDALLAVSGNLDLTPGGPPIHTQGQPDGTVVVARRGLPTPTSANRRSIYLLARRNFHLSLLAVFDQPLMANSCTGRNTSAVVLQSLAMLNDPFVREQAEGMARRVADLAGAAPEERIRTAFRIALARAPRPVEITWSADLLQKHIGRCPPEMPAEEAAERALTHLCHMLLNTNEFLYIE